jgi:hypothetical protein
MSKGYAKRVASLQTPAIRKKISDGVKRARAKETPEQRAAHNKAIAKSYRHTVGLARLQRAQKYGERRDIRRWMENA